MQVVEHIALGTTFSAPMFALPPHIATDLLAVGARTAPQEMQRMAWACRLRAVLRCPGLVLAMQRLDSAVAEEDAFSRIFASGFATTSLRI